MYYFESPENCDFIKPDDLYLLEDNTLCDLPKASNDFSTYDEKVFKEGYTAALVFIHLQKAGYYQDKYLDPKIFNPKKLIYAMRKFSSEHLIEFEARVKDDGRKNYIDHCIYIYVYIYIIYMITVYDMNAFEVLI